MAASPSPVTHHRGPDPRTARLTVVLVHGRGASGDDMLGLAAALRLDDVAWLAPDAPDHTWYPQSFLAPIAQNEPFLTNALTRLASLVEGLAEQGVPHERVALVGFSQGACLSLEFAARRGQRFRTVIALSGGLIGPPGTPRDYTGRFGGMPVFLGCSDIDPHIPVGRVRESAEVFTKMDAAVDLRIYPGMGHTVNEDELAAARALLA